MIVAGRLHVRHDPRFGGSFLTEGFVEETEVGTRKLKLGVKAVGVSFPTDDVGPSNSCETRFRSSAVSLAEPFSAKKLARVELT